jgi:hypothetical protein
MAVLLNAERERMRKAPPMIAALAAATKGKFCWRISTTDMASDRKEGRLHFTCLEGGRGRQ